MNFYENGPEYTPITTKPHLRKRKCTDIICLLIWILFWILVVIFAVWAYSRGNLDNIAQPYDSKGNACGRD